MRPTIKLPYKRHEYFGDVDIKQSSICIRTTIFLVSRILLNIELENLRSEERLEEHLRGGNGLLGLGGSLGLETLLLDCG